MVLAGCFWWRVSMVSCCVVSLILSRCLSWFQVSFALSAVVVPGISTILSVVHLVILSGSSGVHFRE